MLPNSPKKQRMLELGEWIRKQREARGISQRELGTKIGVDNSLISKWESGKAFPTYEDMVSFAHVLEPNDDEFLRETLFKSEYLRRDQESNIRLGEPYAKLIDDLLKTSADPQLDLLLAVEDELLRFADIWNQCMHLRIDLFKKRDYANAIKKSSEILKGDGSIDDLSPIEPRARAYLLDILGNAYYHQGEVAQANIKLDKAVEIGEMLLKFDNQGNRAIAQSWKLWLAAAHDHRGDALRVLGHYTEARIECEKAGFLSQEIGEIPNQVRALRKSALVDLVRGAKSKTAIELCNRGISLLQEANLGNSSSQYELIKTYATRGWAENVYGNLESAKDDHRRAIRLWTEVGETSAVKHELMKCYRYLADDYEQEGNIADAESNYRRALRSAEDLGIIESDKYTAELGMIYLGLAKVEISSGDFERAFVHLNNAYKAHKHSKDQIRQAIVLRAMAKLELAQNKISGTKRATEYYEKAISLLNQVRASGYAVGTTLDLASLSLLTGNQERFSELLNSANKRIEAADEPFDEDRVKNKYRIRYSIMESLNQIYFRKNSELAIRSLRKYLTLAEQTDKSAFFKAEGANLLAQLGHAIAQKRGAKATMNSFAEMIINQLHFDEQLLKAARHIIST